MGGLLLLVFNKAALECKLGGCVDLSQTNIGPYDLLVFIFIESGSVSLFVFYVCSLYFVQVFNAFGFISIERCNVYPGRVSPPGG
jgi:hypothetical protein